MYGISGAGDIEYVLRRSFFAMFDVPAGNERLFFAGKYGKIIRFCQHIYMPTIKEKIRQELSSLYFLDSKERDHLLDQLDKLPEKALSEILDVIKNSKNDQKKYLSKINKSDPQFVENLKVFLDGNTNILIAGSKIPKI